MRAEIELQGYDDELGAYVSHYGSREPDASLLLLPRYGYIAADDRRMRGTFELIQRELTRGPFVWRYRDDDGLELVAITQDVGQAHEQLDATYEGTELTVAFNPDYLLSGVEVTPGDEIHLDTVDAQKPAVIRAGEAQEFLYLLMPVRVS